MEEISRDEALIHFLYQAPIGLVQTRSDGAITLMNPMAAQLLLPLARQGNITNLLDILREPAPHLDEQLASFTAPHGVVCEALRITSSGTGRDTDTAQTLELSLLKLDPDSLMASITDVTLHVQRQAEAVARRLHKAARIDPLTQLPNREAVCERLTALLREQTVGAPSRFALLLLDCDRFGQVNDSYGRHTGDALLRALALRLARAVRDTDLVSPAEARQWTTARLGGDEFLVVLEGVATAEDTLSITRRLLDIVGRPYDLDGQSLHVGVTAGIVLPGPVDGDTETQLHDVALALAEAKRSGSDSIAVFEPAMRLRAAHRGHVEHDLYQALARRELFAVYQPLVELGGDRILGFEALARWEHPLRGLVMPQDFIPVAEESRLITPLGDFILETACRQAMQWHAEFGARAPRKMSVNLSRAQLAEPDVVDRIEGILRGTGYPPSDLMLEVTESLAAQDQLIQRRLRSLKDVGVRLALDDFGTGYSSLSSLHQFPVDVIKIDRSFVHQVEHSGHHRVLVEATVRVARSLGMRIVAEGIETEAQRRILTELECDEGQGYLFGRPANAAAAGEWLRKRIVSLDPDTDMVVTGSQR